MTLTLPLYKLRILMAASACATLGTGCVNIGQTQRTKFVHQTSMIANIFYYNQNGELKQSEFANGEKHKKGQFAAITPAYNSKEKLIRVQNLKSGWQPFGDVQSWEEVYNIDCVLISYTVDENGHITIGNISEPRATTIIRKMRTEPVWHDSTES